CAVAPVASWRSRQAWRRHYSTVVVVSIVGMHTRSGTHHPSGVRALVVPVRSSVHWNTVPGVIPDDDRRQRLAYAIRAVMAAKALSPEDVAERMEPRRSAETIARWRRGQ